MNACVRRLPAVAILLLVSAGAAVTQEDAGQTEKGQTVGELRVKVRPEEAYIFVDGKPTSHRNSTLKLAAGEHTITVANYGYAPQTQKVTVTAGERKELDVPLNPSGDRVSGPWGRIQIEGAPGNAAVFLNGTTPAFFVGHVDEMNNNFINKQQLIVPPGQHQLNIIEPGKDQPLFSGAIEVKQNQRLIVYLEGENNAKVKYKDWAEGTKTKPLKRFEASTATATIAVAPVTANLATNTPTIHCNQPGALTWSSTNAGETTLSARQEKLADSAAGSLEVDPKQTTKYELRAAGPGGIVNHEATINVDPTVQTSLTPSEQELKYVKVGDKVQEQGESNLNWTAAHADSVKIEPVGPVNGTSGSKTVQPTPTKDVAGAVDEMLTYKLTATNQCGGADSSTASIHLTGSITGEQPPAPTVAEVEPAPQLPQTGSPLPALAFLGVVLVSAGILLQKLRTMKV